MAAHRLWAMVGGRPGSPVVLVVTSAAEHLRSIAETVAATGCYVFCAVPAEVMHVFSVAILDLVVVLSDVPLADRALLVELHEASARQTGRIEFAFGTDEEDLADFVVRTMKQPE